VKLHVGSVSMTRRRNRLTISGPCDRNWLSSYAKRKRATNYADGADEADRGKMLQRLNPNRAEMREQLGTLQIILTSRVSRTEAYNSAFSAMHSCYRSGAFAGFLQL